MPPRRQASHRRQGPLPHTGRREFSPASRRPPPRGPLCAPPRGRERRGKTALRARRRSRPPPRAAQAPPSYRRSAAPSIRCPARDSPRQRRCGRPRCPGRSRFPSPSPECRSHRGYQRGYFPPCPPSKSGRSCSGRRRDTSPGISHKCLLAHSPHKSCSCRKRCASHRRPPRSRCRLRKSLRAARRCRTRQGPRRTPASPARAPRRAGRLPPWPRSRRPNHSFSCRRSSILYPSPHTTFR